MAITGEVRAKELIKLGKMKYSRPKLASDARRNPETYIQVARDLDLNLDIVFDIISPDKSQAINYMVEDLNLAMVDTPNRSSSTMGDLKGKDSIEDAVAGAYMQRLYTIGSRFPRHPLVATFTLTPISGGSVFNPYSTPPAGTREKEQIEPEVDYTQYLAESWSTMDDTERLPLYNDTAIDRTKRRVTELGQIEIMKFTFTEDAKAIYKYGTGIQWSFESAFRQVRMQLLGMWVMRQAITDRIWMLMDLFGVAIDFAHAKNRTYAIPAGGNAGVWTWEKLDAYNMRWRVPYLYDKLIGEPAAITKFKKTDWGSDNWTLGHIAMMGDFFSMNYQDARMNRKIQFVDIPGLTGEDGESNAFGDTNYLFLKRSAAVGQVFNTGMTQDRMETIEGNQSNVRYFTIGSRFYGIHPKAVEVVTLS